MNPYWNLPFWIPAWLRRIILSFEPYDEAAFMENCHRILTQKYAGGMFDSDWMLIAADITIKAHMTGSSSQWLAYQWAIPDPHEWID